MRPSVVFAVLVWFAGVARADDPVLSGRVTDDRHGPVEGAFVFVAGSGGLEHVLTTDADGRYRVAVKPGTYRVVFAQGPSRSSGRVVVGDRGAVLDGRVDATAGETIIVKDQIRTPPVLPKPRNWVATKTPPYSERAIMSDAWTKAWLLLDINEHGVVERFKFLKRPGYDLEKIAATEAFRLQFDPARDERGRAIPVLAVWQIEWPAAWYIIGHNSPLTKMPSPGAIARVPCQGDGPWNLSSKQWIGYRDCSQPDLSRANREPWVLPP